MKLTCFHPKKRGIAGNKNTCPVNVRFIGRTSDIRNFSENFRSDVKTSEVATLLAIYNTVHIFSDCT